MNIIIVDRLHKNFVQQAQDLLTLFTLVVVRNEIYIASDIFGKHKAYKFTNKEICEYLITLANI